MLFFTAAEKHFRGCLPFLAILARYFPQIFESLDESKNVVVVYLNMIRIFPACAECWWCFVCIFGFSTSQFLLLNYLSIVLVRLDSNNLESWINWCSNSSRNIRATAGGPPCPDVPSTLQSAPRCSVTFPSPAQRGVVFGAGEIYVRGADPSAESSSLSESVADKPTLLN